MSRHSRRDHSADTRSNARSRDLAGDRVDWSYAILAGLYLAAMATPGVFELIVGADVTLSDGLFTADLIIAPVITVGTALVVRRLDGLPARLGGVIHPLGFLVVAGLAIGGYVVTGVVTSISTATLVGIVGGVPGLYLGKVSRVEALVRDESIVSEFHAAWPIRWAIPSVVTGLLIIVVSLRLTAQSGDVLHAAGLVGLFVGPRVVFLQSSRTYRIRPAGLERSLGWVHSFDSWEQITDVELLATDAIVIRRRGWWRLPLYCDLADIDDPTAVQDTLERHIPG